MRRQWRLHKLVWKLSGRRLGRKVNGMSVLELTTTGHKSGQPRSILITYVLDGGHPALIATNAGADVDPAWVRNLRSNPTATVKIEGTTRTVRARFLDGGDWDRAWKTAVAASQGYENYRAVLTRPIPIVRLEAVSIDDVAPANEAGRTPKRRKSFWRGAKIVAVTLVTIVVGAVLVVRVRYHVDPAAQAPMAADAPAFQGRISALSDLDQAASGYANGKLALLPGQSDQLSVIDGSAVTSTSVTNSVIGWVTTHRRSPDGRFVYVAEVRGQAPAGTEQISQPYANFPKGKVVTVVDTAQPTPVVVKQITAGRNPGTLDVSPSGDLLAVGTDEAGAHIRVWNLDNGLPVGDPIDAAISFPESDRSGVRALRFDPSGNFLAVNLSDRAIGFFAITRDASGRVSGLSPHGELVTPGGEKTVLTEVEFTPDGRFLLMPDVQWGTQATWTMLTTSPGRLISIRFDSSTAANHAIASTVDVWPQPRRNGNQPGRPLCSDRQHGAHVPSGHSWTVVDIRWQSRKLAEPDFD
jgi:deazaflavin-dependent oxidoreductase (nitroreductase family)